MAAKIVDVSRVRGMEVNRIRNVVLSHPALMDKRLAAWMFLRLLGREVKSRTHPDGVVVEYWEPEGGEREPDEDQIRRWELGGAYAIDLGRWKYNADQRNPQSGSACESVLRDLGVIETAGVEHVFLAARQWLRQGGLEGRQNRQRAERRELELADGNGTVVEAFGYLDRECQRPELLVFLRFALFACYNNATGGGKFAGVYGMTKLIRDLADIGEDPEELTAACFTVFEAFYRAKTGTTKRDRSKAHEDTVLAPYFERGGPKFLAELTGAFTADELLRNLYATGTPLDSICELAEWWVGAIEKIRVERRACEQEWRSSRCEPVRFAAGQAVQITSDRHMLTAWILKEVDGVQLVVARNSRGNVAIVSREVRGMDRLGEELRRREPDRWYYDGRQGGGACLNGSHSRPSVARTCIPIEEIRDMVLAHVRFPGGGRDDRRRGGGRPAHGRR